MLAVTKAAVVHQIEHISKRALDALSAEPQADRTHTGRVEQPATTGQWNELRGGGGVAPTLIAHAYIVGALHGIADERVDDGALTNTACAK